MAGAIGVVVLFLIVWLALLSVGLVILRIEQPLRLCGANAVSISKLVDQANANILMVNPADNPTIPTTLGDDTAASDLNFVRIEQMPLEEKVRFVCYEHGCRFE